MTVKRVPNLQEYFRDAVHSALQNQHVDVQDHTEYYLVNLLTLFARSEALFVEGSDGPRIPPLVVMLTQALEAQTRQEKFRGLQRLGDVSLFMAGFFAHGFARKLVDIDYHISMGGHAYATLAQNIDGPSAAALRDVFAELAAKFQRLVDALNEISDSARQFSDQDVLRLYEVWLKTGSTRAQSLLGRLGVVPAESARSRFAH
ncbi:MAG: hypothetical protein R3E77_02945 [Steroidobacteraceae bacterium]